RDNRTLAVSGECGAELFNPVAPLLKLHTQLLAPSSHRGCHGERLRGIPNWLPQELLLNSTGGVSIWADPPRHTSPTHREQDGSLVGSGWALQVTHHV